MHKYRLKKYKKTAANDHGTSQVTAEECLLIRHKVKINILAHKPVIALCVLFNTRWMADTVFSQAVFKERLRINRRYAVTIALLCVPFRQRQKISFKQQIQIKLADQTQKKLFASMKILEMNKIPSNNWGNYLRFA